MNLTRCPNGHFYDADTNTSCPHCQGGNRQVTVAVERRVEEDAVTKPLTQTVKPDLSTEISNLQKGGQSVTASAEDDVKTISFSKAKMGMKTEPVVGWLVCTEGPHLGQDFRIKTGKNFVGRAENMDVALTKDNSVSRDRHAIVLYEPKAHMFLVQPGEARELCYLNDSVVLAAQEIKRNDVLMVGESKLMFFPCCDAVFNWSMVEKKEEA